MVKVPCTNADPRTGGSPGAKAASAARDSASPLTSMLPQRSEWRTISISSEEVPLERLGPPSAIALTPFGRRLIGVDDLADRLAANHVAAGEGDMGDILDAFENGHGLEQA